MVSLVIPTLNAANYIETLLDRIAQQTRTVDEIIVVDSESTDNTVELCSKYKNVRVIPILRSEFDHGRTRDMALRASKGDYILFITQDALPQDEHYVENLLKPFSDPEVAVVGGRQTARSDAWKMEKLVRAFNYPETSHVRSKVDIPEYGIKTYFCSDVCSAYKRDIYVKLGGFEYPLKTNEDMFFAATVIHNGYKVAYAADAVVIHSHNFTLKEQYQRNYIQGIEIERHSELLGDVSQNAEGMRLVKHVSKELLKRGQVFSFIHFGFDCCARLLGSKMGKQRGKK